MKLNTHQSLAIVRFLTDHYQFNFLYHHFNDLAKLFNGDTKELRIIPKYGMAGKLWNSNDRIYVSGWSRSEVDEETFEYQQKELDDVNEKLRLIVDCWG
jgi:hypothetical protein